MLLCTKFSNNKGQILTPELTKSPSHLWWNLKVKTPPKTIPHMQNLILIWLHGGLGKYPVCQSKVSFFVSFLAFFFWFLPLTHRLCAQCIQPRSMWAQKTSFHTRTCLLGSECCFAKFWGTNSKKWNFWAWIGLSSLNHKKIISWKVQC